MVGLVANMLYLYLIYLTVMTELRQAVLSLFKTYKTRHLFLAFILFWTPVIIFAKLAGEIVEKEPIGWDVSVLHWIHGFSTPLLDSIFFFFTTIGGIQVILPVTIATLAYLLYKKQRLNSLIILFGVGGAAVANGILKLIFHRDRPAFWHSLVTGTGYSFPSGHAMASSALVLCLVVILWDTRWRTLTIITGVILVFMVGLSRLYFGVHYPTDVVAGWSVSLIWIVIVASIAKGVSARRVSQEYNRHRNVI
ncbi:MAG: acid phosphatase [Candidatus Saccharibacteria bacterium]|nr:acid phosphatase [Candidatus Saccharibacteria bacterium]